MTAEEHSSSAGRPEFDLGDEPDVEEQEEEAYATVAGGLCRLSAPDSLAERPKRRRG
jgi:hypothetical protein